MKKKLPRAPRSVVKLATPVASPGGVIPGPLPLMSDLATRKAGLMVNGVDYRTDNNIEHVIVEQIDAYDHDLLGDGIFTGDDGLLEDREGKQLARGQVSKSMTSHLDGWIKFFTSFTLDEDVSLENTEVTRLTYALVAAKMQVVYMYHQWQMAERRRADDEDDD